MRIDSIRITNFKCFAATDEILLSTGFNVIVGQNNAGKTALVQALGVRFDDVPHRSLDTARTPTAWVDPMSEVVIALELERDELAEIVLNDLHNYVHVPVKNIGKDNVERVQPFIQAYLSSERHLIRATFADGEVQWGTLAAYDLSEQLLHGTVSLKWDPVSRIPNPSNHMTSSNIIGSAQLPAAVADALRSRIHTFRAERRIVGEMEFGHSPFLSSDAADLPQILNQLQGDGWRFRRLNELMSIVLPDVRQVAVETTPESTLRILVWTSDPSLGRRDLAVPLAESGTGIGQVLAILCVLLTSDYPRSIIIDEPQSFLHPGAVRKLFDVLRHHSLHEHQYIVTTHSPTVLTASEARTILLVRKEGMASRIDRIDADDTEDLRLFLAEIGARLADVFGADGILWVEGPTEERCFPLILTQLLERPLLGNVILGVRQTGDFDCKQARAAFDIYRRLSRGRGLLPPAVGFVFDREGRTERERDDLIRESGGTVAFLPRRMYENYLLNPEAIAAVAAENIDGVVADPVEPVTTGRVAAWLDEHRWNREFFDRSFAEAERSDDRWMREVHAAKLLASIFSVLSQTQVGYDKMAHGEALTRWLLRHAPEDLREVAVLIDGRMPRHRDGYVPSET